MKVGRNDLCHCGSGKKYKKCCLPLDEKNELASAILAKQRLAEQEEVNKEKARLERESHKMEMRSAMDAFLVSGSADEDDDWDDGRGDKDEQDDDDFDWEKNDEEDEEDDDEEGEEDDAFDEDDEDEGETEPLSPEEEKENEAIRAQAKIFWDNFHTQNLLGKITLFENKLAEPEPLHHEFAFDMLTEIYEDALTEGARALFPPLIEKLRQAAPKAYRHDAHYYLENLINEAFAANRAEALPELVHELAPSAGRHPDTFGKVLAQLAYHGQLHLINEAMQLAWPRIKKSSDIVFWAIDDYAAEGLRGLLFRHLEQHGSPLAGDEALFAAMNFFVEPNRDLLNRYIALLCGHESRPWRAEDFDFTKQSAKRRKKEAKAHPDLKPVSPRDNLSDLSMAFVGYAHRRHNVSYIKGEIARECIVKYIFMRLDGELKPRQSMLDAVLRPKSMRELKDPPYHPEWPSHVRALCPHPPTFDRYFSVLLHMLNPQYHKLAALFELTPVWLEFLVAQQLIEPSHQEATMAEMQRLHKDVLTIFEKFQEDPALYQALKRWPELATSPSSPAAPILIETERR